MPSRKKSKGKLRKFKKNHATTQVKVFHAKSRAAFGRRGLTKCPQTGLASLLSGFWPHPNGGQVRYFTCDHGFPMQPLSPAEAGAFLPNSPFPITMPAASHPVTDYLVHLYSCNSAPLVDHIFGTFDKYASTIWNNESNLEMLRSLLIRLGTNMTLQATQEDPLNNNTASKGVISSILIVEQYKIVSNMEDAYIRASKKLSTIYNGNVRDTYKFYQKRSGKKGVVQGRKVRQLPRNSGTIGIVPVHTVPRCGSLLFPGLSNRIVAKAQKYLCGGPRG
ncbi:hypothetical protein THAOC_07962 [Thalassiosira oceanica]|uniref:Uncharacterized protein n=1 Tax=Thalassiosira oceanica TaxID=159749 RepID=K0T0E1_THAOC|nr:hypothetical protein THAOC_07962 [Thalassiosira oceanica]|eukprot:EJK70659.1 hypothetical protein THAOC_07962 [Thalassiosira oceanica]